MGGGASDASGKPFHAFLEACQQQALSGLSQATGFVSGSD